MSMIKHVKRNKWMQTYLQTLRCIFENNHVNCDTGGVIEELEQ